MGLLNVVNWLKAFAAGDFDCRSGSEEIGVSKICYTLVLLRSRSVSLGCCHATKLMKIIARIADTVSCKRREVNVTMKLGIG